MDELNPQQRAVVERVDVVIDGPFEQDKADPSLKWCGSSNQRAYSCGAEGVYPISL